MKIIKRYSPISVIAITLLLSGCGGSDSSNSDIQANSNSNAQNTVKIECNKGIPKNFQTQGKGFFDQELYQLDTATTLEGNRSKNILEISLSQNINGVLYKKPTNHLENHGVDLNTSMHNHIITKTNHYSNNYQNTTTSGLPAGYVLSQTENSYKLVLFNDNCEMTSELQTNFEFQRVDLSGKSIAEFIDESSSSKFETAVLEALKEIQFKFPNGSVFWVPTKLSTHLEYISFSDKDDITNTWLLQKNSIKLKVGQYWKDDSFANFNVSYIVNSDEETDSKAFVEFNGKYYEATYDVMNSVDLNPSHLDLFSGYFNKTAMQAFTEAYNSVVK